jgi:hypothetical protein
MSTTITDGWQILIDRQAKRIQGARPGASLPKKFAPTAHNQNDLLDLKNPILEREADFQLADGPRSEASVYIVAEVRSTTRFPVRGKPADGIDPASRREPAQPPKASGVDPNVQLATRVENLEKDLQRLRERAYRRLFATLAIALGVVSLVTLELLLHMTVRHFPLLSKSAIILGLADVVGVFAVVYREGIKRPPIASSKVFIALRRWGLWIVWDAPGVLQSLLATVLWYIFGPPSH